ncbi:MAG: hypothetical protein RI967_1488 [Planctomycetota bacterium]
MAGKRLFLIVPKIAHPWYDEVRLGAEAQARAIGGALGAEIAVDLMPPARADVAEQNAMLDEAARRAPDGVALDPLDAVSRMPAVARLRERGVPVVLFDSPSPEAGMTGIGNDYRMQGTIAAERLVSLLGGVGKVAVMRGFPTAPNHRERLDAQLEVLARHPGIAVVDGGTDGDDIATARREASAVLAAHPDLAGYLACDASGPIGIADAIRDAGKVGAVKVVGMDGIRPILEAIRDGVLESSSSTKPRMQGSMAILMLWQATLGLPLPRAIDTGIDLITRENLDRFLAADAD